MKPLVIAATGACTPIGTRAWQTGCSLAGGLSSFTRQPISGRMDDHATVSRVQAIEPECAGIDRLIRLAAPALHEALRAPPQAWPLTRPMPVFIALPEPLPERPGYIDPQRFALELPRALDLSPEFLPLVLHAGGAVAGADALAAAYRFMQAHPEVPEVVFGGVDSLADTAVADCLYHRNWLKVNRHSEGFIASEAAAFVRLARQPQARDHVTVFPPAFGQEPLSRMGSEAIPDGAGLIHACQQAIANAHLPKGALHAYWSDVDGSPWRGNELANLSAAFASRGGLPTQHAPAAFLGDTGAASAPLLLSLLHEMRQGLHHPLVPVRLSGHTGLQTVTGHSTRVAAWVAAWDHAQHLRPSPLTTTESA